MWTGRPFHTYIQTAIPLAFIILLFGSEIDQMLSLARHGKLEEIVRDFAIIMCFLHYVFAQIPFMSKLHIDAGDRLGNTLLMTAAQVS